MPTNRMREIRQLFLEFVDDFRDAGDGRGRAVPGARLFVPICSTITSGRTAATCPVSICQSTFDVNAPPTAKFTAPSGATTDSQAG